MRKGDCLDLGPLLFLRVIGEAELLIFEFLIVAFNGTACLVSVPIPALMKLIGRVARRGPGVLAAKAGDPFLRSI